MAERMMRITLDVVLADLPRAERRRHAKEMEVPLSAVPDLRDASTMIIGEAIRHVLSAAEMQDTIFEGCDEFVRIKSIGDVTTQWIEP